MSPFMKEVAEILLAIGAGAVGFAAFCLYLEVFAWICRAASRRRKR